MQDLLKDGTILPMKEVAPPPVPMDYAWARVSIKFEILFKFYAYFEVKDSIRFVH